MCVQRVMVYGSETWPMRVEELRRLERAERMMIRWMCEVTLKGRYKSEELRKRLDIENVADVVRKSRLGWLGFFFMAPFGEEMFHAKHLFQGGLVICREEMGKTGYQLVEIRLSQKMLERVGQG